MEDVPFNPRQLGEPLIDPQRLHLASSPTPGVLPLHSLKVVLLEGDSKTRLHLFFDPVKFQIEGGPRGTSFLPFDLTLWTRLRELVFVEALFEAPLSKPDRGVFSSLREGSLRISYHFSDLDQEDISHWIQEDLDVRRDGPVAEGSSHVEEVLVHVPTEEDKRELLESLANSLLFPRITVLVKASTES
ncbi:hypothetical protein BDY24DRAFT_382024 [Mrakia frigida]|uniref:uncharacterized protein n=1 Tax=Mrakia frigida TaxID=29902 RepID=UPI003FCBF94A